MRDPLGLIEEVIPGQAAHVVTLPPKEAEFALPQSPLPAWLSNRLAELGVEQLYSHQAQAWDLSQRNQDFAVVTGTSSGKTLCYSLPTLAACRAEPMARALFLFPTKALGQDQLGKFEVLAEGTGIGAATFDGDSPKSRRSLARREAHVILTNPDMLHVGILPNHESWTRFLRSLRVIVIDEMHVYRGVFGSHFAGILRRLLRLCEWHGAKPQIIACSATIGNAGMLFQNLTGRAGTMIMEDGAQQGEKTIAITIPQVGDGNFESPNVTAAHAFSRLVTTGHRCLAFCRSRTAAELVLRYAREHLEANGGKPEQIESYRGGYTVAERRAIEKSLFKGDLRGLATTNAMELGVDVGGLDAVLLNGYPGTIASFWQQLGRAGRSGRSGLGIMVTHPDPVESFLAQQPDLLLDRKVESANINLGNPAILRGHLMCACQERAMDLPEVTNFSANAPEQIDQLVEEGLVTQSLDRYYFAAHRSPASGINIRGTDGPQITIFAGQEELGSMEEWRALRSLHEGAIYLHRGRTYLVDKLNLAGLRADVHPVEPDYYTVTVGQTIVQPEITLKSVEIGGGWMGSLTSLKLTSFIQGYRRLSLRNNEVFDEHPLDLPHRDIETVGVSFTTHLPDEPDINVVTAVHSAEHALVAIASIFAGCDRRDLGSAWYGYAFENLGPAIYIFDGTPGGIGLSEALLDNLTNWMESAKALLEKCNCEDGCPLCLLSPHCESNNEPLSRQLGLELLRCWTSP